MKINQALLNFARLDCFYGDCDMYYVVGGIAHCNMSGGFSAEEIKRIHEDLQAIQKAADDGLFGAGMNTEEEIAEAQKFALDAVESVDEVRQDLWGAEEQFVMDSLAVVYKVADQPKATDREPTLAEVRIWCKKFGATVSLRKGRYTVKNALKNFTGHFDTAQEAIDASILC